jgi:hypothetical protein
MKKFASFIAALLQFFAVSTLCAQPAPKSPVPVPPRPSSQLPGQQAPGVTDVWVVFKTHCDLGYTMSAEAVFKKYRERMMDSAIQLIEADRAKPAAERFKWSIAGWPMAEAILGPEQTPERRAKIEEALREGSIAVHALSCTTETDALDLEDLVRSLGYSSRLARAYGHPLPIAGKMTDVPAHSWVLPTLLDHAGIKFLQLAGNYANRSPLLPQLFWWEGPDGSRILCNYTASKGTPDYGSTIRPPQDWPAKNYLAVVMTHDNEGPPSPAEVAAVRAEAAKLPGVRLHLGTLDDFARAVLAEKPALPVVRGDMADPWIHGVMSMPAETKVARNLRPLLPALDLLDTELRAWGLTPPPLATDLAEAYEQSLLYGEHTWGAMTPGWGFFAHDGKQRGTERFLYGEAFRKAHADGFYQKFEASFDDHRAYIRKAEAIVTNALQERLGLLARAVRVEGARVVVFNPLPWERSGLVEVNGRQLHATDVPANGYKTFPLPRVANVAMLHDSTLETPFFRVSFDLQRGGIASLVEKSTRRELVDKTSPYALGQFLHERFSEAQTWDYYHRFCVMNNAAWGTVKPNMPKDAAYAAVTPRGWTLSATRSAAGDTVTLTATDTAALAKGVAIVFTFPASQPCVDTEWRITDKSPDAIPEGGWLCFPFAVEQPRYLLGRLGGPMDLAKDQIPGGNRHLYAVQSGVALNSPDGTGASLCPLDSPLVSVGEPGLWKYTFDCFPQRPTVFVNLYNNMWNTDYPYWVEGSWSSRVRVWPTAKGTATAADLAGRSWEARVPLLAAVADGAGGRLPKTQAGVSVSRPGVLVTAFGANPDGQGTLLRVWDQSGESGKLTVTLPGKFTSATPVNLRGDKTGEPVAFSGGKFNFKLGAFAPASFTLE